MIKQAIRPTITGNFKPSILGSIIASAFTPEELFKNGEQGVWYGPSDLSTLFQDAAGTTPVTSDGDPVGLMLDKSGNANHATQSVSASRPTYRTDGTLHWLEFDGVDDYLTASTPLATQPNSAIVGVMMNAYAGAVLDGSGSSGRRNLLRGNIIYAGLALSYTPIETSSEILSAVFDGATSILRKSGVQPASGDAGVQSREGLNIGASYVRNTTLSGNIYGMVLVDSRRLSIEEIVTTEQYLASKSGVTL